MSILRPANADQPVLSLGLMGFSPELRSSLAATIALVPTAGLAWRVVPFWEADAWFISGAQTQLLPDGDLRVLASMPSERDLTLRMKEVNRPVAFSTPLASGAFEPRWSFHPLSSPQVHDVMQQFADWLQPLLFRAELGAHIIERGTDLRGRVYHVRQQSRLLAVLDFRRGSAAVMPTAKPSDMQGAIWDQRPPAAVELPPGFASCTPAQLIWTHVRHSTRDLLPVRYRSQTIYYRHAPRVPMAWLSDSMLMMLSTLSGEPCNLHTLVRRTAVDGEVLASDLACLYYAGAVTTTPMKATTIAFNQDAPAVSRSVHEPWDSVPGRSSLPPIESDRTAPAMLSHRA